MPNGCFFDLPPITNKRCTRCHATKPVAEFYPNAHHPTGYTSWCKACDKECGRRNHIKRKQRPPNIPIIDKKVCYRCRAEKPIAEFYLDRMARDGLSSACKECCKAGTKQCSELRKNRHKTLPATKRCRHCQETKPAAKFHLNRASSDGLVDYCNVCCKIRGKEHYMQRLYGISADDYDAMVEEQNGVCALCNQAETLVIKNKLSRLSVDHCHTTNKVRALLCNACNVAIGRLEYLQSKNLLTNALAYIKKHKGD